MYLSTADRLPEKPDVEAIKKFRQQMVSHPIAADQREFTFEQFPKYKWICLFAILIILAIAVFAGFMKRKGGN
jgi:hypothetical protein